MSRMYPLARRAFWKWQSHLQAGQIVCALPLRRYPPDAGGAVSRGTVDSGEDITVRVREEENNNVCSSAFGNVSIGILRGVVSDGTFRLFVDKSSG